MNKLIELTKEQKRALEEKDNLIKAVNGPSYPIILMTLIHKMLTSDTYNQKKIVVFVSNRITKDNLRSLVDSDRIDIFTEADYILSKTKLDKMPAEEDVYDEKRRALDIAIEECKTEFGKSRILDLDADFFIDEFMWIHSKLIGIDNIDDYLSVMRKGRSGSVRLTYDDRKKIIEVYKKYYNALLNSHLQYIEKEELSLDIFRKEEKPKYDCVILYGAEDMTPREIKLYMKASRDEVIVGVDIFQSVNKFAISDLREVGIPFSAIKTLSKSVRTTRQIDELVYAIYSKKYDKHYAPVIEGNLPQLFVSNDDLAKRTYLSKLVGRLLEEYDNATVGILLPNESYIKKYSTLMCDNGYAHDVSTGVMDMSKKGLKIMTYPQSKGLEFNFVIMPEFDTEDAYTHIAMLRAKICLYLIGAADSNPLEKIDSKLYVLQNYVCDEIKDSELALIIKKYPQCLNNKKMLKSLLLDFIHDKGLINTLLFAFDEGIVLEIKNGTIDEITKHRFVKKLENDYGMSQDKANTAIDEWVIALKK